VVLRHFAVHAFAPIVIASVAGTVINRLEFGDVTEFSLLEEAACCSSTWSCRPS
jgi:CIC family chloride channel protein